MNFMSKISRRQFSCMRDELTIGGFEYLPNNFKKDEGKKLAPVIMSHGFMSDYGMCDKYAQELAKEGFATFDFDFNGGGPASTLSNGKTTDMSVLTEVEDLLAVVNYVCSLDYIDENQLTLLGCSQGGFVSALLSARLGDKVKKLVLFYPALCIPDDARKGEMISAKFDPENPPEYFQCAQMKLSKKYVTDVNKIDSFAEIVKYKGSVCILHGDQDAVVNISYAKKAFAEYTKGLSPDSAEYKAKELHIIKGAGHVFFNQHDEEAISILKEYMKK